MVIKAFTGFQKKPNETKQPTGGTDITVRLKENTSIINPVFLLTGYNLAHNYIQWGSRYYFIDDIVIIGNDLAEYHCSTDVLATYKTNIGSSSQYILRSASASNGEINDNFYPMIAHKTYSRDNHATPFIEPDLGTFIFGVQGHPDNATFGCTTYYALDVIECQDLMDAVFNISDSTYDSSSVVSMQIPEEVYKSLINPQQYIVSCMFLPFEWQTIGGGYAPYINLGWYSFPTNNAMYFDPTYVELPYIEQNFTIPKHPQASARGVYLNNAPYSDYTLSYMPFGDINIPADLILNSTNLYTKVIVDVVTGKGTLRAYAGTSESDPLVASVSAQVGVPIAISGGLYDLKPSDFTAAAIDTAAAMIVNPLTGAGTGIKIAANLADAASSHKLSTSGSNGALDFLEYDICLYATFTHVANDDNAQHGRPLCDVRTINTLSGYIQCLHPDLDLPATLTEKQMIVEHMSNGFYYT